MPQFENKSSNSPSILLSFFLRDATDAVIILAIVTISSLLGFWQERNAADAVEKLLALVKTTSSVIRDGSPQEIPVEEVVPGDVVLLSAGAAIPGDCVIIDSEDLFVNEASLTGETYPLENQTFILAGMSKKARSRMEMHSC